MWEARFSHKMTESQSILIDFDGRVTNWRIHKWLFRQDMCSTPQTESVRKTLLQLISKLKDWFGYSTFILRCSGKKQNVAVSMHCLISFGCIRNKTSEVMLSVWLWIGQVGMDGTRNWNISSWVNEPFAARTVIWPIRLRRGSAAFEEKEVPRNLFQTLPINP